MENIPKLLNWAEKIAVKEGHKKPLNRFGLIWNILKVRHIS